MPIQKEIYCFSCNDKLYPIDEWLELNYDNLEERAYECINEWCTIQKVTIIKK